MEARPLRSTAASPPPTSEDQGGVGGPLVPVPIRSRLQANSQISADPFSPQQRSLTFGHLSGKAGVSVARTLLFSGATVPFPSPEMSFSAVGRCAKRYLH